MLPFKVPASKKNNIILHMNIEELTNMTAIASIVNYIGSKYTDDKPTYC